VSVLLNRPPPGKGKKVEHINDSGEYQNIPFHIRVGVALSSVSVLYDRFGVPDAFILLCDIKSVCCETVHKRNPDA
jgi:hypothetical protein